MPFPREILPDLVSAIDESRIVNQLSQMVATPSVNPFDQEVSEACRELEMADLYESAMQDVGMEVARRDVVKGRPNVFGRVAGKGNGPTLMLAGHLDTVGVVGYDDPFNPAIRQGRLHGRGSCDMKAGLAAFVEVARVIKEADLPLKGHLLIAGIADEEHQMIGSREISKNGPKPDFAIVGEPTELDVCAAHKGQLCMHIRTYGKAVHSSVPEQGVNAIVHMAEVIRAFEGYNQELQERPRHPVCGHGKFNPGVIRGGDISSAVPDYCELEVDRRILSGETLKTVVYEYRDRLEPLKKKIPNFNYEIGEPVLQSSALDTPADSPVVTSIVDAYTWFLGKQPQMNPFTGGTDAPNLHCPAVICGPGSINQAHSLDEFVEINQVVDAARIYLHTALELLW